VSNPLEHICVCICTFKRPHLLHRLLRGLERQETGGLFTTSAVVIDNDPARSAGSVVNAFCRKVSFPLQYFHEPVPNISLARNRAVRTAEGDSLAFIDDDESPGRDWLRNLHQTLLQCGADSVLGPVEPYFETTPPDWVVRGRLCERDRFRTGTRITNPYLTRTGNVLIRSGICREKEGPFDPSRGKTGGEDYEFFHWLLQRGGAVYWCDEAPVYESVPPDRLTRSYFLKRGLLRGGLSGKDESVLSLGTLKSLVAVCLYTAALPVLAILGQHHLMSYLTRECDHIGKLLGFCGIQLMRERSF
jgi:succinoglycan biosynthesis protein ExoM